MGYTDLSERDRGDIRAWGKHRDRGHHTRVVTQKHRLPTHIHRMLLDHLRIGPIAAALESAQAKCVKKEITRPARSR